MIDKKQWGGFRDNAGAKTTVGIDGRRRSRGIQLNDDEHEVLKRLADEAGMSVSEYVRMKVFESD